ncbi:MAG TPA: outer membrane beta-barrel protein [Thermoanaerobaculia bacterium]|jgi:opacity protein-like surface antigen
MSRSPLAFALALALAPAAVQAQSSLYRFELTPTVSHRWGGTISGDDSDFFETDLDVDNGTAYGITLDIPLSSQIQLELLANRQPTELRFDQGLFGDSSSVADIDITYYHVGLLWQWGHERVTPFFVASLGGTNLDPDLAGAASEDRFSLSVGGGVKVLFSDHVGLRFEGRGFFTDLGSYDDRRRDSCRDDGFYRYDDRCYGDDLTQGQASVGLILAW